MIPSHDPNRERRLHFQQVANAFGSVVARHANERLVPARLADLKSEAAGEDSLIPGEIVVLNHVLWLCDEIHRVIRLDLFGEAVEYVGMLRGMLWTTGVMSLQESRDLVRNPTRWSTKEGHG